MQRSRRRLSRRRRQQIRETLVRWSFLRIYIAFRDIVSRSTWFTQNDVKRLQDSGINTVRLPVRMLGVLPPSSSFIVPSARVLDRRRSGQPDL